MRIESDRAAEVLHAVSGRGGGEAAVDQADEETRGGVDRGDFIVPLTEDVVGVAVVGIEREGGDGVIFHEAGVGDFGFVVRVEANFSVADCEREKVDGVIGCERMSALSVGKGEVAKFFLLDESGAIERGVGVLAGDFLEDEGVVGLGDVGGEVELEGRLGIETRFGGAGVGEELRDIGRESRGGTGEEKEE